MKEFIIRLLKLALLKLEGEAPVPSYSSRARELVLWAEAEFPGFRGERLHHQVINRLVDEFPNEKRRDLNFEIEKVLQELK